MEILGMSIGSWILIIFLAFWFFVAIKVYFFGGFKKKKGGKASIGACCDTGDEAGGSKCEHCHGCDDTSATQRNAVMPKIKLDLNVK